MFLLVRGQAEGLTEVTERELAQEMRKGRWSNEKSTPVGVRRPKSFCCLTRGKFLH